MMLIYCNNKGCGKSSEATLDVVSGEVHCAECGKVVSNITEFAKKTMKTLGQIKRDDKKQQAFSVKCDDCRKENPPKINEKNIIVCSSCGNELKTLPKPFQQVIRNFFRSQKTNQ
jgi:ribosomal protein L34E